MDRHRTFWSPCVVSRENATVAIRIWLATTPSTTRGAFSSVPGRGARRLSPIAPVMSSARIIQLQRDRTASDRSHPRRGRRQSIQVPLASVCALEISESANDHFVMCGRALSRRHRYRAEDRKKGAVRRRKTLGRPSASGHRSLP